MSNMSYCRWENTSSDMADCQSAMEDMVNEEKFDLSRYELDGAINLMETALRMLTDIAKTQDVDVADLERGDFEDFFKGQKSE